MIADVWGTDPEMVGAPRAVEEALVVGLALGATDVGRALAEAPNVCEVDFLAGEVDCAAAVLNGGSTSPFFVAPVEVPTKAQ